LPVLLIDLYRNRPQLYSTLRYPYGTAEWGAVNTSDRHARTCLTARTREAGGRRARADTAGGRRRTQTQADRGGHGGLAGDTGGQVHYN